MKDYHFFFGGNPKKFAGQWKQKKSKKIYIYGSKDATRKLKRTCDENETSDKKENEVQQGKWNNENYLQINW